jgi:exonuclease SbcD
MPTRVIFCSDTHLGFDHPIRPRSERVQRGPDFFANFQRVLDYAQRTAADLVVHGGDFFFRSRVPAVIVDRAYQMLLEFVACGIPIAIVPGNHERSELPPSLFLNHPLIRVFDRPRTHRFEFDGASLAVSGFPYLRRVRAHFRTAVEESGSDCVPADHRILCVHHAVDGAVVGPAGFTFHGAADVIAADQLPERINCVLAGHIHRHQVLDHRVPVVYCGSIERTSFAERGETKGFCELIFRRKATVPEVLFHELPTRPMVDFDGRGYGSPAALLAAFEVQAALWQPQALVRIQLADYPDRRTSRALNAMVIGPLSVVCDRRPHATD